MSFSEKQKEFFREASHRWNIKTGATRSGKTYMDYFLIPMRIREVAGLPGLIVIIGYTKGSLQKNVIKPLQDIWGTELVSDIKSDNTATMFGETVYCLGADKVTRVNVIRGSSIKYCYGDEVVTWAEEIFTMLKSRLDKDYSKFDGTCNPENPEHWFHRFLFDDDPDIDKYVQNYTIFDNPFLPESVKKNLCAEYKGTVYYNRYILGQWTRAEGLIYKLFADDMSNNKTLLVKSAPYISRIVVGVDFGGTGSAHTFVATGFDHSGQNLYALLSERHTNENNDIDPDKLGQLFVDFINRVIMMYSFPSAVYCDSAEQTLILGLKSAARKNGLAGLNIQNALKTTINDRIRCAVRLMAQKRLKLVELGTETLQKAFCTAVWNSKNKTEDERLDDGTSDIDTLDAFEYTYEREISKLIKYE